MALRNYLEDLQPYFYCTDEDSLKIIQDSGTITAGDAQGIVLRSFPLFGKKKFQTVVEDSLGKAVVITEAWEKIEYAICVYLPDSEVASLTLNDGSVIYRYKGRQLPLPKCTKVMNNTGHRFTLKYKVKFSSEQTWLDQVCYLHSKELWIREMLVGVCTALTTLTLMAFLMAVVQFIFAPNAAFTEVVGVSSVLYIVTVIAVVLYRIMIRLEAVHQ